MNLLEARVQKRTKQLTDINSLLSESEARYRTLMETVPQLVWTTLPTGECNYLSPQWLEYTGLSFDEQLGYNWIDKAVHPDDRARTLEHWMGAVKGLHLYDIEYRIRRRDGVYRWFKTRGSPIRNKAGEIIYWMGTSTDVEDQKQIESELRHALSTRDDFLSIASHELRTPLTGIKIQTQMFKRTFLKDPHSALDSQKVSKLVNIVDQSVDRLTRLVDDMLDISRIQTGKLNLQLENVEISSLILDVMDRLRPELSNAGMELKLDLAPNLISSLDRFRFEQVLTNLTTNAIRYAHHQPLNVKLIKVRDKASIRFKDRGAGIPKEASERVFSRFERLVSADEISGMGLGLFISKEIIESLGGSIKLEYEESPGACFVIDLPLKEAP